ncbi:MAG TPA: hypothetical protein VNI83_06745, partial [Vicinamibacterales bacterium]|nr:hypothetical protein [Vicinamibacterales bacterium]
MPRLAPAPRTLIVTSRCRDLLGPIGERAVVNEIRRFELFTDGRAAAITLARPDLVVERAALIRELARDAQEAGATLVLGRRLRGLEPAPDGVRLELDRSGGAPETMVAGRLVGADGAFSRVAALAGWPSPATVPLVQAVVRMPPDLPADTTRVWFIPEDTRYFYWLIPEGEGRAVAGLIGEDGASVRRRLHAFLERHRLVPLAFQAARTPLYRRGLPLRRRLGGAEVYVVGDAGAQVKVTTVGGLVTGFRGARAVAEAILDGGRSRALRALHRELTVHWLVRRTLDGFSSDDYARLIDLVGARARRHLGVLTRDEADRLLVRVCLDEPRLLLLAARRLIVGAWRSAIRP